jgi:hypothetical protein
VTCASASPQEFTPLGRGIVVPANLPPTTVRLHTLVWPTDILPGPYTFFLGLTPPNAFANGHAHGVEVTTLTVLAT